MMPSELNFLSEVRDIMLVGELEQKVLTTETRRH